MVNSNFKERSNIEDYGEEITRQALDRLKHIDDVVFSNVKNPASANDIKKLLFEQLMFFYTNQLIIDNLNYLGNYEIESITFYKEKILDLYPVYFDSSDHLDDRAPILNINLILILCQDHIYRTCKQLKGDDCSGQVFLDT